jgi:hypothetical protein
MSGIAVAMNRTDVAARGRIRHREATGASQGERPSIGP